MHKFGIHSKCILIYTYWVVTSIILSSKQLIQAEDLQSSETSAAVEVPVGHLEKTNQTESQEYSVPKNDSLPVSPQERPYLVSFAHMLLDNIFHQPMLNSFKPLVPMHPVVHPATPAKAFCQCGVALDPNSGYGEFPWRVLIGPSMFMGMKKCAGTLISNRWILTSASCIRQYSPAVHIYTADRPGGVLSFSSDWILHANYDPFTHDNDIALIRIDHPIPLSSTVQPVCLPWRIRYKDFSRTSVTVSGLGYHHHGGITVEPLEPLRLPFVSTSECAAAQRAGGHPETVTSNMVCTNGADPDVCKIAFGGSLDYYDHQSEIKYMIGIPLDMHYRCGSSGSEAYHPQIATKIIHFLDWIHEKTSNADFCIL